MDVRLPLINETDAPFTELSFEELVKAMQLRTDEYALQSELVWRQGEDGVIRPTLLSERQHFALGRLAADGTFEHIATILDPHHPVRAARE